MLAFPDDFETYERRHLRPHSTVARLVILDLDIADLSYDNVLGRFRRLDRPQAQSYFGHLLESILQDRFRETRASGGSYAEFVAFRQRLEEVASMVGGHRDTPASIETVRVLRKALAARQAFIDPATELAHVQPRTSLYLLELYALLHDARRANAFRTLLNEPAAQWARCQDHPILLVELRDYQEEYLERWLAGPPASILEMATGTGKTVLGLGAIARLAQEKRGQFKVLILAPSHAICDQWRTEIRNKLGLLIGKGDYDRTNLRIDVRTIQSIAMRAITEDLRYDLFILDEVHHAAGPEWRKAARVPATRKLGLSATIPRESRAAILRDELGPVTATLTLGEAKSRGILPEFKWIVHPVELSPAEANEFRQQTEKIRDLFRRIREDPETVQTVREIERRSKGRFRMPAVETLRDLLDAHDWATMTKVHRPDSWITLFGLVQARQWISHRSIPKIESAMRLLEPAVAAAKCMVTTMDIETAEAIGAQLPNGSAYVVHSQVSREEQRRRIQRFKDATSGALIAPKLLDEGIDVPDASVGFNVAGTKSRIQLVQRLGRILRPRPGKQPIFHHFVTLPPRDLYIEGIDDVGFVEDLVWIKELGRQIDTVPEFATPAMDAEFVERVKASGYEAHARRLERERAEVELPSGSIRFDQILAGITPEAAAKILPYLDVDALDEATWEELTAELSDIGVPPGIWWLHARFRDEPSELARILRPVAATARAASQALVRERESGDGQGVSQTVGRAATTNVQTGGASPPRVSEAPRSTIPDPVRVEVRGRANSPDSLNADEPETPKKETSFFARLIKRFRK